MKCRAWAFWENNEKLIFWDILETLFIYIIFVFDRTKMSWSEKWFLKWLEPQKCWNNNSLKLLAQYCTRFNYQHWHYTGLQYQPNTMRKKWHPTDCHPPNTDVGTIIDKVVHVPLCTGIIRIRLGFSFFLPLVKFKKKRKNKIKHMLFQDLFNLANPHL